MKKIATYCLTIIFIFPSFSQYYLRGEVKDEKNHYLQNVKIFVHSVKALYQTGTQGSFGFTVLKAYDSLTFSLDGYESKTIRVKTDVWQNVLLKISTEQATKNRQKLISITKDFSQSSKFSSIFSDETYFQLVENEFVNSDKYPNTGFSLDVDKASYSNVRRFINMNSEVPPDAVRIEELINYFNLHYREPA